MYDSTSYSYRDKAKRPQLKANQKVVQNSLPRTWSFQITILVGFGTFVTMMTTFVTRFGSFIIWRATTWFPSTAFFWFLWFFWFVFRRWFFAWGTIRIWSFFWGWFTLFWMVTTFAAVAWTWFFFGKGQLISKCPLVSSNRSKNQRNLFRNFCPTL